MLTNIIATILVSVVTNIYSPTQYLCPNNTILLSNPPQSLPDEWKDEPPISYGGFFGYGIEYKPRTRPNPNVKITEVRKITKVEFDLMNKHYSILIEDKLISKDVYKRKVTQTEEWLKE